MSPPRLYTLPLELINHIGSYLHANDQKSLSRLSQTCKLLRDDFQPMLFRAYTHYSQPVSRLVKFLRAIASRPDLATAVTSLTFYQPIDCTSLSNADRQFIDTCIANLGLPSPPIDWQLEGGTRHIVLETVIAYSPTVQTLELPVNEEWGFEVFASFPRADKRLEFPHLRTLSIFYYYISGDGWAVDYDQISLLLEASPNVEHLALPTVEGFYAGRSELPSLKSVKTVDLGESGSGLFFVTSIITECSSVRSFTLHWLRSSGYDEDHKDWSVVEVWDALVHVKQTLEELTFESDPDIPSGFPNADSVSSLAGFEKLRALKVDGRCFEAMFRAWTLKSGSDDMNEFVGQLLPSEISSLTIWAPSDVLISVLFALARARARGLYEYLAKVEIGPSPVFQDWIPNPDWSRSEGSLREKFSGAGVQLGLDIPYVAPEMWNFMQHTGLIG